MNKILYISAPFKPIGKYETVKIPTGEKKKGFFGGEKDIKKKETQFNQTGWSDCKIDGEKLSKKIQEVSEQLNAEGYTITSMVPITSGNYNWDYEAESFEDTDGKYGYGGYGYGLGYSFTEGILIVAYKTE